jgi:LysM repeat protein
VYIVRRGDSLWTVTQRYARLPMWLLQQYNPDTDFGDMRPGTELTVPKVEEMSDGAG